jgi:hypothetical protein
MSDDPDLETHRLHETRIGGVRMEDSIQDPTSQTSWTKNGAQAATNVY